MTILTIRTDKPEAEIGLFEGGKRLTYETWLAHRELAETIHLKIDTLLKSQDKTWQDLEGIICLKGPGSFTGLRIGLSVGNALAYSLNIPIVATEGDKWIEVGIKKLNQKESEQIVTPYYGEAANITKPTK